MLDFLTHQVLVYQRTAEMGEWEKDHRVLMDELNLHVYSFPGCKKSLNEEEWSEFLLSFTDRLHGIIMNFEFRGLSFLCYLNKVLSWQLKTFYRDDQKGRHEEWIHERESIIEYDAGSGSCESGLCLLEKMIYIVDSSKMTPLRMASLKQRLLLMVLKNISSLEEDEFLMAFPYLGLSRCQALELRKKLLLTLANKKRRREQLILKRNENYFRLNLHEKKKHSCVDSRQTVYLENRICLYRKRLVRLDDQIRAITLVPSNEDIANLLQIPKGSVDSGLFYLRSHLEKMSILKDCFGGGGRL